MLHSAIVVRQKGAIHEKGLFTTQSIRKGTLIWELDEPTFTWKETKAWPEDKQKAFDRYGFQCGIDRYSLPMGISREMNHSCDPNTLCAGSDSLVARRYIRAGEEITYDYSTGDIDDAFEMEMECHCNTPLCRGKITNRDYLNLKWQEQYGSNLPPYVLDAIKTARQ